MDSQKNNTNDTSNDPKQMAADGYKEGVIVFSNKEGDCPYVIQLQMNDSTYQYDPIDLPDQYKEDGKKIWFKFTPSRRPNRCNKANPVFLNNEVFLRN